MASLSAPRPPEHPCRLSLSPKLSCLCGAAVCLHVVMFPFQCFSSPSPFCAHTHAFGTALLRGLMWSVGGSLGIS